MSSLSEPFNHLFLRFQGEFLDGGRGERDVELTVGSLHLAQVL